MKIVALFFRFFFQRLYGVVKTIWHVFSILYFLYFGWNYRVNLMKLQCDNTCWLFFTQKSIHSHFSNYTYTNMLTCVFVSFKVIVQIDWQLSSKKRKKYSIFYRKKNTEILLFCHKIRRFSSLVMMILWLVWWMQLVNGVILYVCSVSFVFVCIYKSTLILFIFYTT